MSAEFGKGFAAGVVCLAGVAWVIRRGLGDGWFCGKGLGCELKGRILWEDRFSAHDSLAAESCYVVGSGLAQRFCNDLK
jgi:hypothetical protein